MAHDGIYFVIDDRNCRGGMTDRLKAAVGLYYLARSNEVPYKFIHTAEFDIRDYLVPNRVDWSAEPSEVGWLPWQKRQFSYVMPFDDLPEFEPGKQYLCRRYGGNNILEKTGVPNWRQEWRKLFWELFRPSDLVQDAIDHIEMPERYAVENARFVNSLGQSEATSYNSPLPDAEQERLIDAVLETASKCERDSDVPVVVYSDSVRFLQAAAESGFSICDPTGVGNVINRGLGEHVRLMLFVNMLLIAQAEQVYAIRTVDGFPTNSLYQSGYARYSAIIGGRPFIKVAGDLKMLEGTLTRAPFASPTDGVTS